MKKLSAKNIATSIVPTPKETESKHREVQMKAELKALRLQTGKLQALFDSIKEAIPEHEIQPLSYKPRDNQKERSACTALIQLSDWHIGEVVEENQVDGFNCFNYEIAKARISRLSHAFLTWIEMQRAGRRIDDLAMVFLSDLVSGDIHQELRVSNEFPLPVQIVKAAELAISLVSSLAPQFKTITLYCQPADNHGRLEKKPQAKDKGMNNVCWVVYKYMESALAGHKNVKIQIAESMTQRVQIGNMQYLLTHGDTIKGWAGIPYYGIERSVAQEAKRRMQVSRHFNKILMGHFHVPMNSQWYNVTGSLSGTSEFDHGCGRHADPAQCFWIIHPEYGEQDWCSCNLA